MKFYNFPSTLECAPFKTTLFKKESMKNINKQIKINNILIHCYHEQKDQWLEKIMKG